MRQRVCITAVMLASPKTLNWLLPCKTNNYYVYTVAHDLVAQTLYQYRPEATCSGGSLGASLTCSGDVQNTV